MSEPSRLGDIFADMGVPTGGPVVMGERMAVIRTGEREPMPSELRYAIASRDGFHCAWCWSNKELQIDHIIPWSAGGSNDTTNLRLLCGPCNRKRSNYESDSGTAHPKPITLACLRCTGEDGDSTVREAFCLKCMRFTPTRWDQIRLAQRHEWEEVMSWDDWKARMSQSQKLGYWPLQLVPRSLLVNSKLTRLIRGELPPPPPDPTQADPE